MKFFPLFSAALVLSVFPPVFAGSIGVNFGSGRGDASIPSASVAGLVAQANWNNASGSDGTLNNLDNETGSNSGASVTWATDEEWSVGGTPADANGTLLNGFVSENNDGTDSTITFTGIPYVSYDLYVYMSHDRASEDVDISGPFPTFRLHEDDTNISAPVTFNQQSESANPNASNMGNYALFPGLSGSTLALTLSPTGAAGSLDRNAISGIQIVETTVVEGLPEIETSPATSVTSNGGIANGNLVDNGDGADEAAITVYWGTSDGGTDAGLWANSAGGGTRTSPGVFAVSLSGLVPNTTYHYRAFASNSEGDAWASASESFTTPAELPTVVNLTAGDVSGTSATLGGEVTSTGGDTTTLVIFYGDNDGGTGAWDSQLDLGVQSGPATGGISGLASGTTYYFRAAATNSAGTTWATSPESFTTTAVTLPNVTTLAATGVNGTFATLNGEVTGTGGDEPEATFYYGTTDGGTDVGSWQFTATAGSQSGSFSRLLGNLQPSTTYFFRARVQNAAGSMWGATTLSFTTPVFAPPTVVINEIHFDEDDKTVRAEFIELHNPSDTPVNLAGYQFTSGIDFTFPSGTILSDGAYLVVAEDPATMDSHFGYSGALGPFENGTTLKNSGETITLSDPSGNVVDRVDYKLGFPWPTVGDEVGTPLASPSIELINPFLDNDLGGSWRSSGSPVSNSGEGGGPVTLVTPGSGWRYRKGTSFPVADGSGNEWADNGYDDSADGEWLDGTAVFGYGDGDDTTVLSDMQGNYISIFLRREFTIAPGEIPNALTVNCYHDDGAVVYINGVEVERFSTDNGAVGFPPAQGFANGHERAWSTSVVSGVASYLVEGTNVIAIHAINETNGSSDFSIDAELITVPSGGGSNNAPTPGAANSTFSLNAPPQVRQVSHLPKEPVSGEEVVVSAKVTDPDGVASVTLEYQLVNPGDYFCRYLKFSTNGNANPDPRFEDPSEWTSLPMSDDGNGGDALASDSIYSVTLPAALQTHRRLIRYRISVSDTPGAGIRVPYADDPQPNFAYFVYDGTPDWTGVIRPGDTAVTYPGELMSSIATYFLLSKNEWVDDSQFGGYSGSEYLWPGTLVYDGKIYDHVQYRPRGGVHRYQYGKNFWKFDFPRGHRFEARDRNGKRYKTDWNKLNFSSIVQQVNFNHRGEQGLFEGVGFRLFELAGVPACQTHYNQFYVIDETSESGANQYEGDYYGLFLSIEQMDGQYLDQHDLPDGNLYKIEGHSGDSNNQGPFSVSDRSDVTGFISGYRNNNPTAQWWRDNFNLESYYSYRTIVEGIHHYDIAGGKNYFYYHNPNTDKFQVLPWDLDLTWANNMFGSGNHDFSSKVAQNPAFNTDYQNRVREIMDLLYNNDQANHLIEESVRDVWNPAGLSLVGADRRLWDNNPRITTKDRYYDVAADNEFSGMIDVLKNYVGSRGSWMTSNLLSQENVIPDTPVITYSGVAGFPANGLQFTSSTYSSGTSFAAMEWRVAEVYNPDTANYVPGDPLIYEIENPASSGVLGSFNSAFEFPVIAARPGNTYRARVRHQDSAGRWSHWSEPVEFVAGTPDVTFYAANLRVSEIHYDPAPATPSEEANGWRDSDFEFIELYNISNQVIDLTGLRFTKGVDFDFPDGTSIGPKGYLVFVKNEAAFESRYGTLLPVVGTWDASDNLSSGENLKLSLGNGTAVIEFVYGSTSPWPTEPDGTGFSLTLDQPLATVPGDHANALSWRPSRLSGGSPGTDDHLDFDDWLVSSGLGAGASPTADPDRDGLNNLLEFALASNPLVASSGDLPQIATSELNIGGGSGTYLTLTFRRQTAVNGLGYFVEVSTGLDSWDSSLAVLHSRQAQFDGSTLETWRLPMPLQSDSRRFMRLRVVQ
ncbi:MAG: lamin tail domain-containing protein [Verrucomicrobiaceae bacterium]